MFKLGLEWPPFTTKPHRKNVAICHPAWSRAVALNAVQHFGFGTIIEVAQKKVRMDARQMAKKQSTTAIVCVGTQVRLLESIAA